MRTRLTVGAILFALATPIAAQAHTIDKGYAARTARLELSDYADYRCNQLLRCEFASYPDISRYSCFWYARRHAARCVGGVDLFMEDALLDTVRCTATVHVRLGRNTRIRDWECF